jgi:hypothetical protein
MKLLAGRASPYLDQPLADRGERRSWLAHGGKKDASIAGTTLTAAISHAIIRFFPRTLSVVVTNVTKRMFVRHYVSAITSFEA